MKKPHVRSACGFALAASLLVWNVRPVVANGSTFFAPATKGHVSTDATWRETVIVEWGM